MSGAAALGLVLLVLAASWAALLFAFRDTLRRLWREPVLRQPVLIVESDDWGPAPVLHAERLARICEVLSRHRDPSGRAAVMTVGVVLAVPDNRAIRATGYRSYVRRTLLDDEFRPIRDALLRGREQGVLALQLHGLEHLWPEALLRAGQNDERVRRWIDSDDGTATDALPPPLQSRWTDGAVLPSRSLAESAVARAAADEAMLFHRCFGEAPEAAVPPTFVWNAAVERAWAAAGVHAIVTPGRRFLGRDAAGRPAPEDLRVMNGEAAEGGAVYVVRDIYFEPARGHTAAAALEAVGRCLEVGRPALLETHRVNFTGDEPVFEASLQELDVLLTRARQRWPTLRFLATAELARGFRARDPALVVTPVWPRLACWVRRAATVGRLRKLSWLNGMALAACALLFARRAAYRERRVGMRAGLMLLALAFSFVAGLFPLPAGAAAAAEAAPYVWDKGIFVVPLTIRDNSGVARRAWPVTTGVPLPVGAVDDPRKLRLTDTEGREIPAQFTVLGRYRSRDDSLRWVLLDFQVDLAPKGETVVQLRNDRPAAPVADPIEVRKSGHEIRVRTGVLEVVVPTRDGTLLRSVSLGGKTVLQAGPGDGPALRSGAFSHAERSRGPAWNTHGWEKEVTREDVFVAEAEYRGGTDVPETVEIESAGPMHAVILVRGRFLPTERGRGIVDKGIYRYTTRLHFYRGHSFVAVEHSVDNADRSQPQWSYLFREATLSHGLRLGADAVASGGGLEPRDGLPAAGTVRLARGQEAWLDQAAGTTEPLRGRTRGSSGGYRIGRGEAGVIPSPLAAGERGRYLDISDGSHGLAIAARYLWQEGPRAIALAPDRVRVLLHADNPGRKPDAEGLRPEYSLDFGERNLHDVLYYFHSGDAAAARVADVAEAFEYPLFAYAPPAWYSDSGVWYQEIGRLPGGRTARGVEGDEHWPADRVGVRGHGNPASSYNSGGHHESLASGWLGFMRSGALGALERNLVMSRWAIAHNPGWAYRDNVLTLGDGEEGLEALDRQLVQWDRVTGYGPKDFYLWRSDKTYVAKTPRGPIERDRGLRSYLNGYKVLPDHEHYALFRLFEYYYLTGDRRALDAIHGFVNWAVNFQHRHLFGRKTRPLSDTELFVRDPQALYRGHYARVYTWMLYTTLAGYQATDSPVFDLYARWQVRRLLALLRDRHGQLTSARDASRVLKAADGSASVLESRAQPWMEAQGVLALHEAYKAYGDERILDGLWGQADYFGHHALFFPSYGMLNNWTAMPNRVLGTGADKDNSLQPHRHDGYVQIWPLLYHYSGWPAVRERYQATEAARRTSSVSEWFLQTGLWERENVPKRTTRAPDAVSDLRLVSVDRSGITLQWTSPRAYGPSGRAQRYFVKYSDKPIVEYAPTDHPARIAARERIVREVEALAKADARRARNKVLRVKTGDLEPEAEPAQRWDPDWYRVNAFWMAEHVDGEPNPAPPGSRETFTISKLAPHAWFGLDTKPGLDSLPAGTYYVALCAWDEDRNLSRLSNVVKVELR